MQKYPTWRRSRPGLFLRRPAVRGLGGRGSPVRPGARQAHKARSRRRPRGAGGRRDPDWGGPPGTLPQSQAVWTRLAPPRPRGRGPASQPKARPLGAGPPGLGAGPPGLGAGQRRNYNSGRRGDAVTRNYNSRQAWVGAVEAAGRVGLVALPQLRGDCG